MPDTLPPFDGPSNPPRRKRENAPRAVVSASDAGWSIIPLASPGNGADELAMGCAPIAKVPCYIDQTRGTFRRDLFEVVREVRRWQAELAKRPGGPKIWHKERRDFEGKLRSIAVLITQPSPQILTAFDRFEHVASYMELSYEFCELVTTITKMKNFVRSNFILLGKRKWRESADYFDTHYACREDAENSKPSRNTRDYHDLSSKLSDSLEPASKFELRFQKPDTIRRRLNVNRLSDARRLNARLIFDENIKVVDFAGYVQRKIRPEPNRRRALSMMLRATEGRAQGLHDWRPRALERERRINDLFDIPSQLTWGARSDKADHVHFKKLRRAVKTTRGKKPHILKSLKKMLLDEGE